MNEKIIEKAVNSFVGKRVDDITPDKILKKIQEYLKDPTFNQPVKIDGNIVTVGDQVVDTTVRV